MRIRFAPVLFALALMGLASVPVHGVTVNFADPQLEDAVRDAFVALGTPLGGTIDSTDLDDPAFVTLEARGRGITDLGGIEFCVNLETLLIGDNEISDISDLAGLTSLSTLDLGFGDASEVIPDDPGLNNNVTDISPLGSLTNLALLNLAGNPGLSNISTLSSLTGLQILLLGRNSITDYSAVASLSSLIGFYCGFGGLTDAQLAAVAATNELEIVFVPGNEITTLDGLDNETNLSALNANYNKITDISALSDKTELANVFLNSNRLRDIQPLVDNSGIGGEDIITLGANPLRNDFVCNTLPVLLLRFTTGAVGVDQTCQPSARALTVNLAGTGDTFVSPGITDYPTGEIVTVTAHPIPGSGAAFSGWSGAFNGLVPIAQVNMATAQTLTATFTAPVTARTLTVSRTGEGIGIVSPGVGVSTYADGSIAVLTASPVEGEFFGGWSGTVNTIERFAVVPMIADAVMTASFGLTGFNLTVATTGDGTVQPQPDTYAVAAGTLVTLTATPSETADFSGWEGDVPEGQASLETITVTMDQARTLTATFTDDGFDFTLNTAVTGTGDIDPGPPGLPRRYNDGDLQNITAVTLPGSGFAITSSSRSPWTATRTSRPYSLRRATMN